MAFVVSAVVDFVDGPEIPEQDPRFGESSLAQVKLNERMFDDYIQNDRPWSREIAQQSLDIYKENATRSNALSDYQLDSMKRNDARYWSAAVPFEDALLEDVNRFDSQAYKDQQVAQAKAGVTEAFDSTREQTARGLQRRGVNPNSGAFAAMQNQTGIAQASALANAANKTRQAADQVGLSTKMQMYGGMRGLAGLGATNAQLGISSMSTGNQSAQGMTGAVGSYLSNNNAAQGAYNSGVSSGINAYSGLYSGQLNAANIAAQNDPMAVILGVASQVGSAYAGGKK